MTGIRMAVFLLIVGATWSLPRATGSADPSVTSLDIGPEISSFAELERTLRPAGMDEPPPLSPSPPSDGTIDAPPLEGTPLGATAADPAESQSVPSPRPDASFRAIPSNQKSFPPDTQGAAGKNHLMVALNTEVQIQKKDGAVLDKRTLDEFWSPLSGGMQDQRCNSRSFDVFDPKLTYDSDADRWVVTSIFCRRDPGSGIFLAVSTSSDPTGGWRYYSVDADAGDAEWADYPSLGVTGKWIIVTSNMFLSAGDGFTESQLAVFEKQRAYEGTLDAVMQDHDPQFTLVPANAPSSAGPAYLVTSYNAGRGCLRVTTITGTPENPTYSDASPVYPGWDGDECSPSWRSIPSNLNSSPQREGQPVNAGDHRIRSCSLKSGFIWCAHGIFLPADSGDRAAAQWWQFTPDGAVIQRGRLDDPGDRLHYTYPSLAVNGDGAVLLGFSRFATDGYPSAGYALRLAGDPPGTLRATDMFRRGQAPYVSDVDSRGRLRWGDYSATVMDPTDDELFWTIQEYSANHVNSRNWSTWWASVATPPLPADTESPTWPASTTLTATQVSLSQAEVSWTAAQDNIAVTAYDVSLNNTLQTTTAERSVTITGLRPGTVYDIRIEARDANNNSSTDGPATRLVIRDSEPPSWSQGRISARNIGTNSMTIEWSVAADDVSVGGYLLYRAPGTSVNEEYQGDLIAELGAGTRRYVADGLRSGTPYAFWVEAIDTSGNVSTDGPAGLFSTGSQFLDTDSSVFGADIVWMSAVGITKGCNPPANDRYCPERSVTRGQMASFLVRALALRGGTGSNFFSDDDESIHEADIDTLADQNITRGCNPAGTPPNSRFCPDDPVTRGQMASFLVRALQLSDGADSDLFVDDDLSVHESDINRLASAAVTKGCDPPKNANYCPEEPVTRGQMAAFLHRSVALINELRSSSDIPLLPAEVDAASVEAGMPGAPSEMTDAHDVGWTQR